MINEFDGQFYDCSQFVPAGPAYTGTTGTQQVCNAVSAVAGQDVISGTDYIRTAYNYIPSHRWRNIGIVVGMMIFFLGSRLALHGNA
jgi:ABC-type multidrug transport system permease subunit